MCKAIEDLKKEAAIKAVNEALETERKESAISLFKDNVPLNVIAKSAKTTVDVVNSWLLSAGLITK